MLGFDKLSVRNLISTLSMETRMCVEYTEAAASVPVLVNFTVGDFLNKMSEEHDFYNTLEVMRINVLAKSYLHVEAVEVVQPAAK